MDNKLIDDFRKLLDVNVPIIFIHDFDFARVDAFLSEALGGTKIIEWNPATGCTDFYTKVKMGSADYEDLETFLLNKYCDEFFKGDRFLILKEVHDYLEEKRIKALLQMVAQRKLYDREYSTTIIIVSSIDNIPEEVKRYVSYLEIDYPSEEEIDALIKEHIETNGFS